MDPQNEILKTERLQPNRIDYNLRLEFEALPQGRYQLQVVAFWLDAEPLFCFSKSSRLCLPWRPPRQPLAPQDRDSFFKVILYARFTS
jgi:hypothetical protein